MKTDKPSILMIVIDALRADCAPFAEPSAHLRAIGLKAPDLPALTRLVRGARSFTQAIACSSYTSACHGSLFTGLVPAEHGVRAFSVTALSREVHPLAEILTEAGYATCAMSDQPLFFQPQGLLRGFQLFLTAEEEALAWWDSYEGIPRFLFMHLWDIHQPYGMHVGRAYRSSYSQIIEFWRNRLRSKNLVIPAMTDSPFEDPERYHVGLMQQIWQNEVGFKAGMDDYLAGLALFDRGRLKDLVAAFAARGLLDGDTVVVVTSDHGEGRDIPPSQLTRHGNSLTDDQIRIPLYLRIPGLSGPDKIGQQVSQADIAPTLLDALGLLSERTPPRSPCNGRSLLPLLRGQSLPEQAAYAEISTVYKDPTDNRQEPGTGRYPIIRYRMLRYPHRKYWLVGKPVTADDETLVAPTEELLQVLFHDILGRRPTPEESAQWLKRIEDIPATDIARRRALVQDFERSGEFRHLPKYAMFDLLRDPLELKPVDARQKTTLWVEYAPQLAIMNEIDQNAREGEPLVSNEADEAVILRRLQGLGYVE